MACDNTLTGCVCDGAGDRCTLLIDILSTDMDGYDTLCDTEAAHFCLGLRIALQNHREDVRVKSVCFGSSIVFTWPFWQLSWYCF